jgi:hypothetical protein
LQWPSTGASTKGPHPAAVEANPTLTNRVTHKMTYEHQSSSHPAGGRAAGIGTSPVARAPPPGRRHGASGPMQARTMTDKAGGVPMQAR